MKRLLALGALLLMAGCANFSTTQTDTSYNEQGQLQRKITTQASASTLFDARSELAKFKATQTDKTQSASVGSLNQESSSTNMNLIFEAIGRGVVSGLNPVKP